MPLLEQGGRSQSKKMDNKLTKIILGDVVRGLITSVATFWATKHAIGSEVAQKLLTGDTVLLWQGTVPISIPLITSVLVGISLPIIFPICQGIWSRCVEAYKLIVARATNFAMTKQELKDKVADASVTDIIKTVATGQIQ